MSVPTTGRRSNPPQPGSPEQMSRIDGCPECVHNTEAPHAVEDTGRGSFNAHYRCADCGHKWECAWWPEPFEGDA